MGKILGFGGYEIPTYGAGPRTGYGVENPTDFNPSTQYNTGIGDDWFKNMDQWKDVKSGQMGYDPKSLTGLHQFTGGSYGETGEQVTNPAWAAAQSYGSDGFSYKGEDGKRYIIHRGTNGDNTWDSQDGYTITPLHQDNKIVAYNGIPHDQFDASGKYVGSALPQSLGHDKFWRDAALIAAMVGTAGIAGYAMGPAAAGVGGGAGAGAGGSGAAMGGSGAFLGEGVASGIGAWDAAMASAVPAATAGAGGAGAEALVGQAAPTAPGYGAPASSGGLFGSGASGSGGMFGGSVSIPGIGSVSTSQLMQVAMPLLGALGGSQEQEVETTSTKELPEWLQQPVYGPGGLIPNTNALLQHQMGGGANINNPGGLLAPPKSTSRKKPKRRGLL